jgi:hypothetical protein
VRQFPRLQRSDISILAMIFPVDVDPMDLLSGRTSWHSVLQTTMTAAFFIAISRAS